MCSRRSMSSPFASLCSGISRARAGLVCICHVCVCVCVLVACRGPYSAQRHGSIVRAFVDLYVRRAWSKGTQSSPELPSARDSRKYGSRRTPALNGQVVYVVQYARMQKQNYTRCYEPLGFLRFVRFRVLDVLASRVLTLARPAHIDIPYCEVYQPARTSGRSGLGSPGRSRGPRVAHS